MDYEKGSEWRRWDLHVHTISSYDYAYKGENADELLCAALTENEIAAVAVTDHFVIDYNRIGNLRKLAPHITFFPGVELRTDKGARNLHLILIFSDNSDVKTLSEDFNAIMIRQKAKSSGSNETIYWSFEDIIEFAKTHKALVSIHAGKKTNGIDKEISNALPVKEAIKADIAGNVHFFEVGKITDIEDYYTHVFKVVKEKPIIMCSDCHDPRYYSAKESLWIKANPSFEGLLQCLYQPKERVFVGTIPPALDRAKRNKKSNIAHISVQRIATPKNTIINWFNFNIALNSGLIAIIGNKGGGKSALSDIIGHLCKCTTMQKASFLNSVRFRKPPKNYAEDYEATIVWADFHSETLPLSACDYETTIENAQYLPQKYIEDVCNDIDNVFQDEIDKVIFSYVDKTERGTAKNLDELVTSKSTAISLSIKKIKNDLDSINAEIVRLEDQKTKQHRTHVEDSLKKLQETLKRHIKVRPSEVKKPTGETPIDDYQRNLNDINQVIESLEEKINDARTELTKINVKIDDANQLAARIDMLESDIVEVNQLIEVFVESNQIDGMGIVVATTPKEILNAFISEATNRKVAILLQLNGDKKESSGLLIELQQANDKKAALVATADSAEKKYQKYLADIKEWENEKKQIEGDPTTEDTISYFQAELQFLNESLEQTYVGLRQQREAKVKELFDAKNNLALIYQHIYSPIENEIVKLLGDLEEGISFGAEIQLIDSGFAEVLLSQINQKYAGIFKGKTESQNKMNQLIKETEFDQIDSILGFIRGVLTVIDEDIDFSSNKVADKKAFYSQLYNLDYIGVAYKLKMGDKDLEELSPGERGIVLLVFYLALSKNNIPIIIDQPEDNLDNQSVFSKLVPCICEAKKKRQVIIVTHNPNIAIACDAEQIVFCHMDKTTHEIKYKSGAIETPEIKRHVVDVLEGTMPAFDLRKRKYFDLE